MLDLLVQVSAELTARGISHALVGAGALAVHGISRSTFDLDLFTTERAALDDAAWGALRARGVRVDVRAGDDADPLAGVVRIATPGQRDVDVVVGRGGWQTGVARRAEPRLFAGVAVPVAIPSDLALLKLYAGGPQDAWDVDQLLDAAPDGTALAAEIEKGLVDLPEDAADLWRTIVARRSRTR